MDCSRLRENGLIAIAGAGPGGATLARLLQMKGFKVKLFEREASAAARPQGGSLDLRPDSGQLAVDACGLTSVFKSVSRDDAKVFRMVDSSGKDLPGAGEETHENPGPEIDRGELRNLLLNSLRPGTVSWGHELKSIQKLPNDQWEMAFENSESIVADLVIGAEGIGSKIRQQLTPVQPTYTGITMVAAIVEKALWRNSEISEMLGEGSVMFAGGTRTIFVQRCAHDLILVYYSMNVEENWPRSRGVDLKDQQSVMALIRDAYEDWSPDVIKLLTQVDDGLHLWPCSVFPPDFTWETQAGITILGDAAHAMPPFTGKGVNLAMFDSLDLAQSLAVSPTAEVIDVIRGFEARMQKRTVQEIGACLEVGKYIYGLEMKFDSNDKQSLQGAGK